MVQQDPVICLGISPGCLRPDGRLGQRMPKSVLIVDDSRNVRKVLRDFFETQSDWRVGGEAGDGAEAIEKAMKLRPDLILLDVSMPELNGIEAASVLKKTIPHVRILVFTMFDDAVGSRLSTAVGVDLVVPKAEGLTGLVKSLQRLMGTTGLIGAASQADRQEPGTGEQT